jgi:UDP-N-acetylmuramate--alanine ligase
MTGIVKGNTAPWPQFSTSSAKRRSLNSRNLGPLRLMRNGLVDCFARGLRGEDVLLMTEPVYFGGTVDRSIGSNDIVKDIVGRGRNALALPDRSACGEKLVQLARSGDCIVVMGARDDSLSQFAQEVLQRLSRSEA